MSERDIAYLALRSGSEAAEGDATRQTDFVRTIVSGVARWRGLLDHFVSVLAGRPLERIDPEALEVLRIGLYQLRFMNVPDHAAVSESVDLAGRRTPRAKGFVNAILRSAIRRDLDSLVPAGDDLDSISIRLSHPRWLVERWVRRFGRDRAIRIAEANQELSRADLLVNVARVGATELLARFKERGVEATASTLVPGMIRLGSSSRDVADEVARGEVYPMDEGSALVALGASGGRTILDLAAAPGSKTMVLRRIGATVSSHDRSLERLLPLRETFGRMFGENARLVAGDGARPPFSARFDGVLVDAPCSATGIIRRYPAIRWRLRPDGFSRLGERHRMLLNGALDQAVEYCVWATCSLEPEENDDVVRDVLVRHPEFVIDDISAFLPPSASAWIERGMLRLTPESGADGFTAIRMRRMRKTA